MKLRRAWEAANNFLDDANESDQDLSLWSSGKYSVLEREDLEIHEQVLIVGC
jgi:hypothetical protein